MKPTILVVDDDVSLLSAVCRVLRSEGFAPVGARSAEAALAALDRAPPDLVLLDLCMPGTSGLEVLRLVRARGRVPVVAMTAAPLPDGAQFDGVLLKPFDLDALLECASTLSRGAPPAPPAPSAPQDRPA